MAVTAIMAGMSGGPARAEVAAQARAEFPLTDFSRHSVPLDAFISGGPPRDAIPAIDAPRFAPAGSAHPFVARLLDRESVVTLVVNGHARAYPLRILIWHEIVNDTLGGVPVAVTYCPLCNTAIVFSRAVPAHGGMPARILDFGTTGRLRHSDLVMYDRQTESWWQQFTGEALVGAYTGMRLKMLPARLEAYGRFVARHPGAEVLVPTDPDARDYGRNPYAGYDEAGAMPFLYAGEMPAGIEPMARVVTYAAPDGPAAIALTALRKAERVEVMGAEGPLRLRWEAGQASALDAARVAHGRDVGNVVVEARRPDGTWADAVHEVTFAFAFHAFHPDAPILTAAP